MKATRVEIPDGPHVLKPGEYGKWPQDGIWYFCCPGDLLANLSKHHVTEEDDGSITVNPSILCTGGRGREWNGTLEKGVARDLEAGRWHGYLERGVSREC